MKPKPIFSTLIVAISLLFMAAGCQEQDDSPQLPPETQTGARTFGALIDGDVFLRGPGFQAGWRTTLRAERRPTHNHIRITAIGTVFGEPQRLVTIEMIVENPQVGVKTEISEIRFREHERGSVRVENTGEFLLTKFEIIDDNLSPMRVILSGTFAFDTPSNNLFPSRRVTQGRFDIDRLL